MTPKVSCRDLLHNQEGTCDKVYLVEKLDRGGSSASFVGWGRRGSRLTYKHVSAMEASKLLSEKLMKGYKPKRGTVGLTGDEENMAIPMTPSSIYDSVLPDTAAAAGSPPVSVDPPEPVEMDLPDLEAEFGRILRSGVHDGRVLPGAITPDGDAFRIMGESGAYRVTLNPMTCDCPSFRGSSPAPCKHLVGVIKHHGKDYIRSQERKDFTAAVAADMGVDLSAPTIPAAAAAAAPAAPPEGNELVRAIFAPHVRVGEDDSLVPPMERLEWNESHAKRIAAGFRRRKPVMLYGPTGTGKTSMVRAFSAITNRPFLRINCTPQTTVADFVGHMIVKDRATIFVPGPLTLAMTYGYILVVDEVDRADPAIGAVLFPAMEDVPTLTIKEDDSRTLEANPDFSMFLTANALGLHDEAGIYSGSQAVDAALLSRCGMQIFVDYHDAATETKILTSRGIAKNVADKVVKASGAIRSMIASGTVVGAWGTRHAINFAENSLDLESYKEGFSATAQAAFTKDEFNALWEATQRMTGTSL